MRTIRIYWLQEPGSKHGRIMLSAKRKHGRGYLRKALTPGSKTVWYDNGWGPYPLKPKSGKGCKFLGKIKF